ncbi:DUF5714 domain-containing protein [Candidatus Soleaferrea massiliensis]|uniref:DUF5714 domain-containing protein n=1 Tax=Candidatus Soleaferrea massiliensis TaxID=1470354 RepID=UPI00058D4EAE|nr:DUF5714 domain-containing protein [Candidatus Soleaferrea massiliensis]
MGKALECLICSEPLLYLEKQEKMVCSFCQRKFDSYVKCIHGHYICDTCHEAQGLKAIRETCLASSSRNPAALALQIMRNPAIYMHGPEHHTLVGAVLLASFKQAGGDIMLLQALEEMQRRGSQLPGGICGLYGCCGAAVSAGAFYSIVTNAIPLSGHVWGQGNQLTAACLMRIGQLGGPRCCKRDSLTAILTAVDFVSEHLGITMETDEQVLCPFSEKNAQCIRRKCPYYSKSVPR